MISILIWKIILHTHTHTHTHTNTSTHSYKHFNDYVTQIVEVSWSFLDVWIGNWPFQSWSSLMCRDSSSSSPPPPQSSFNSFRFNLIFTFHHTHTHQQLQFLINYKVDLQRKTKFGNSISHAKLYCIETIFKIISV